MHKALYCSPSMTECNHMHRDELDPYYAVLTLYNQILYFGMAGLFAIHFSYHFLDSLTFDSVNALLHISNCVNVPSYFVFYTELRHVIDRFFQRL